MRVCRIGFPHSDISGSKVARHLPEAYRRHATSFVATLMPRHPPYALTMDLSVLLPCSKISIYCFYTFQYNFLIALFRHLETTRENLYPIPRTNFASETHTKMLCKLSRIILRRASSMAGCALRARASQDYSEAKLVRGKFNFQAAVIFNHWISRRTEHSTTEKDKLKTAF